MKQRNILVFFTCLGMACLLAVAGCGTSEHAAVMSGETVDQQGEQAKGAQAKASEKGGIPFAEGGLSQESFESGRGGTMTPGMAGDIDESSMSSMGMGSGGGPEGGPGGRSSRMLDLGKAGEAGSSDLTFSQSGPEFGSAGGGMGSSSGAPSELGPLAGYVPGAPPQPRSFEEGSAGGGLSGASGSGMGAGQSGRGQPGSSPRDFFSPGPSGYEGEDFVRGLTPSDLEPDDPTNPRIAMAGKGSGQESMARGGSSGSIGSSSDSGVGSSGSSMEEMVSEPGMRPLESVSDNGAEMSSSIEVAGVTYTLKNVFFDYDRSAIRPDAAEDLKENAKLLNAELRDSQVLVQGHCDERGTNEYNLVLGERRAQSVKNYLADLGVDPSRISTISYGEDKPFCTQFTPACLQLNRRGHFVLQ